MSFIVKYRSKTTSGREIIRPNAVEAAQISVGRGADCDVQLSDLSVTPHHAWIRRTGETQVEIESEKKLPMLINGRSRSKGKINAVRGGSVRIGPHRLTIQCGEGDEADSIVILVDRDEIPEKADADRLFSLQDKVPGKRISAWTFSLLILAACLVWPIWTFYETRAQESRGDGYHADTMWISGSLSEHHANLANDCQACHQEAFVSVRDGACLDCHQDIPDHADANRMTTATPDPGAWRGFQLAVADMFNRPRMSCASCHLEHEGSGQMVTAPQQFCSDCHTDLDGRLTDTELLNAHDFGEDHPQFRPRIMTTPGDISGSIARYRRISLDENPRENTGLKFPHDMHLSTTNGVARMAQRLSARYGFGDALECSDCHVSTADGTRFEPISMEANCQMCHSLAFDRIGGTIRTLRHGEPEMVAADIRAFYRSTGPRRPIDLSGMSRRRPGEDNRARTVGRFQFAAGRRFGRADAAIRAAFTRGGTCFDCHQTQATQSRQTPYDIVPVRQIGRYMHLGWFDHAAHETEDCTSCHAAEGSESSADVLLPDLESCRDCHVGESGSGNRVASTCAMCHSYHQGDGAPYLMRVRNVRGQRPQQMRDYGELWNRDRPTR